MILEYASYVAAAFLAGIGIGCIVFKTNLVKKMIGFGILGNAVHLMLITIGFRESSTPPIVTPGTLAAFPSIAVDPIPQALVLTSIVIDVSITTLAIMIIIWIYRRFSTIDTNKLKELKG